MILLLDTSTPVCRVWLHQENESFEYTWQADRELAKGLLEFLTKTLQAHDSSLSSLAGIGVFRGPGSFTGLRIGIATMNTVAEFTATPLVGALAGDWHATCLTRLSRGDNDGIVLPEYGRPARITKPRK